MNPDELNTDPRPDEREALIACLGDDAATLAAINPDDEMAQTMREAADMLGADRPSSTGGELSATIGSFSNWTASSLYELACRQQHAIIEYKKCIEYYQAELRAALATPVAAIPAPVELPAFVSMTGSKAIDGAKEYLVEFMEQHFTDRAFHRYIRGQISGSGPLAGDFAFEIARAIARIASKRAAIPAAGSGAARDVLAERQRQIIVEGRTPEGDDAYTAGELARAAATYAVCSHVEQLQICGERAWPWHIDGFKRTTYRRDLVKAGALILAEIERLDRAKSTAPVVA